MNLVFRQTAMTGVLGLTDERNRFDLAHDNHSDLVGLVGGSLDSLMDRNAAAAMLSMGVAEVAMSENKTERAREGESRRERKRGETNRGRKRRRTTQKEGERGIRLGFFFLGSISFDVNKFPGK